MQEENQKCLKCEEYKTYDSFHKNIRNKNGISHICKLCMKLIKHKYRQSDKGKLAEKMQNKKYRSSKEGIEKRKEYEIKNRKRRMWRDAKKRAMEKNLEFSITPSDIIIPNVCPVFDIPIVNNLSEKTDNSPSLDRIDNSKGYVKENICVISWKANSIKNAGTAEEHRKIAEYIEKYTQQ